MHHLRFDLRPWIHAHPQCKYVWLGRYQYKFLGWTPLKLSSNSGRGQPAISRSLRVVSFQPVLYQATSSHYKPAGTSKMILTGKWCGWAESGSLRDESIRSMLLELHDTQQEEFDRNSVHYRKKTLPNPCHNMEMALPITKNTWCYPIREIGLPTQDHTAIRVRAGSYY